MKKKLLAAMMAAVLAVTGLAGCGGSTEKKEAEEKTEAKADVPKEPFGDTIKYDPTVEINDGKDISIELWEWGSDDLFQQVISGNPFLFFQKGQRLEKFGVHHLSPPMSISSYKRTNAVSSIPTVISKSSSNSSVISPSS